MFAIAALALVLHSAPEVRRTYYDSGERKSEARFVSERDVRRCLAEVMPRAGFLIEPCPELQKLCPRMGDQIGPTRVWHKNGRRAVVIDPQTPEIQWFDRRGKKLGVKPPRQLQVNLQSESAGGLASTIWSCTYRGVENPLDIWWGDIVLEATVKPDGLVRVLIWKDSGGLTSEMRDCVEQNTRRVPAPPAGEERLRLRATVVLEPVHQTTRTMPDASISSSLVISASPRLIDTPN